MKYEIHLKKLEASLHESLSHLAALKAMAGDETGRSGSSDAISMGVAASWDDPEIRAKRTTRHAVRVDGALYRSVHKACEDLNYEYRNDGTAIAWRLKIKESPELCLKDDLGREWKLVPYSEYQEAQQ